MERQDSAIGSYAAPSLRASTVPVRETPPHTIISSPVQTAPAPMRPGIGAFGIECQERVFVAGRPAVACE